MPRGMWTRAAVEANPTKRCLPQASALSRTSPSSRRAPVKRPCGLDEAMRWPAKVSTMSLASRWITWPSGMSDFSFVRAGTLPGSFGWCLSQHMSWPGRRRTQVCQPADEPLTDRRGSAQHLGDRGVECIEVTWVAGGDEVAVYDHLGVGPDCTGIDEVGLRRDEGRQLPSLGQARLGEDPRCVADRGDGFVR